MQVTDFRTYKVQVDSMLLDEIQARIESVIAEQDYFADREEGEIDPEWEAPPTPSGEPWCGQVEDVVREVMTMTLVMTARAVRDGRVEHLDEKNPGGAGSSPATSGWISTSAPGRR